MNKKKISVNIIIIIFLFFFNLIPVFSINEKKDGSIKLDELKLTPIIASPTIVENNFFNDVFNNEDENNQTNKKSNTQKKITTSYSKTVNNLIYYTQYGNYYPLPKQDGGKENKCTIHYAGCGPTTSAMIIASYIDKSITPEAVVDYFGKKGYYLGCSGSSTYDNKSVIESFGVKTSTDIMSFSLDESDKLVSILKNYLKAGWTFFALANFKEEGGGHFFWIIDIDENGNFWAFDPWYGRNIQPFNENTYYPFPKYRQIFKVRK